MVNIKQNNLPISTHFFDCSAHAPASSCVSGNGRLDTLFLVQTLHRRCSWLAAHCLLLNLDLDKSWWHPLHILPILEAQDLNKKYNVFPLQARLYAGRNAVLVWIKKVNSV